MTFDMNPDDDRHEWELMVAEIASLKADNARLREAIRREAERHERRAFYVGMVQVSCPCDLCLTDREGR